MSVSKDGNQGPILIGCAPSSGSTLLSAMLDAHSDIHCGPELSFLCHSALFSGPLPLFREKLLALSQPGIFSMADPVEKMRSGFCSYILIDDSNLAYYGHDWNGLITLLESCETVETFLPRLFELPMRRNGKSIWAEKSPSNLYAFCAFLERFPDGRIIYMVRNGLDLVCSLLRRGFDLKRAISIWLLETALCETLKSHPRVLRVRYEDLVSHPRATMLDVLTFLQVPLEIDKVLAPAQHSARFRGDATVKGITTWKNTPAGPISTQSVDRWREELTTDQQLIFAKCYIAQAPEGYEQLRGTSTVDLLQQLSYDAPFESLRSGPALVKALDDEPFLSSGKDYDGSSCFQERFIECAAEKIPGLSFADSDMRALRQAARNTVHRRSMLQGMKQLRHNIVHNAHQRQADLQRIASDIDALRKEVHVVRERLNSRFFRYLKIFGRAS